LAPRYGLPVKIHTGYKISSGAITTEQLRPSHLEPLLRAYPGTRFVLMHAGYPFGEELIAVVKHFSNAYADLCWAWAVNPFETTRFVRSFIHAVSAHKLFAFGGDTDQPTSVVGYSLQMRRWLARALQAEINDGLLRESDAKLLADRFLRSNALAQFDVKGKRAAIHNALARGYRTV